MPTKQENLNYPKNIRFHCTKCGLCCGNTPKKTRHILMLENETKTLSNHTLQPIPRFANKIEGHTPYVYEMRKNEDGKCIFLKDNQCTIYPTRPLICRFYPFNLTTTQKHHTFSPTDECPGIGRGRQLPRKYYEKLLKQAKGQINQAGTEKPNPCSVNSHRNR
jgi:Fe-S-cluster containining protein